MELTITLTDQDEIDMLTDIALKNGKSTNTYVTDMLRTFLIGQIKGKYLETIHTLQPDKIKEVLGKTYTELKTAAALATKTGD